MKKTKRSNAKNKQNYSGILLKVFIIKASLLVILFTLELLLRVTGYGNDVNPFTRVTINKVGYYKDNPSFFSSLTNRQDNNFQFTDRTLFKIKKEPNVIRGFVVGGSPASGYPYSSNQSFSALLKEFYASTGHYADCDIINVSYPGLNSSQIRYTAEKLLRYKPDFIILYTGENEYAPLNGTYDIPFNRYARELRLYALISNLYTEKSDPAAQDRHFIDMQYDEARKSKDDKTIQTRFIHNISAIIQTCEKKKIPLIIAEGFSNLYDMAPFQGINDKEISDFIMNYTLHINNQDKENLKKMIMQSQTLEMYRNNAHVQYLNGLAADILSPDSSEALSYFLKASEKDKIKLRFNTALFSALSTHYLSEYKDLSYVRFASMLQLFLKDNSYSLSGNKICTDHIHLNTEGHRTAAYYLAKVLQEFTHTTDSSLNAFFTKEPEVLQSSLHISPIDHFAAFLATYDIVTSSLYKDRLIPYDLEPVITLENEIIADTKLYNILKELSGHELYSQALDYYINRTLDKERAYKTAFSYAHNYPASKDALFAYSVVCFETGRIEEAKSAVTKAYALSDNSVKIYEYAESILTDNELSRLRQYQGKPRL